MSEYIVPILYGIVIFPIVAFLFTLPYMIVQYRKYGSIPPIRVLIIYSFILYLICAYFLVILPLPDWNTVANLKISHYQIIPFHFIYDFIQNTSLIINNPSTYLHVLKEPVFYQAVYNILLFVPFGIYLRYYFKFSLKKTVFCSFLLSLFFEFTQLTGLYFLYPRNYRLFDVDDLMVNTLGGLIGYFIGRLVLKVFPSRDEIDRKAYEEGENIPLFRRIFAFLLDYIFYLIFANVLSYFVQKVIIIDDQIVYVVCLLIYYIIVPTIFNGNTLGKRFFKMKLVSLNGKLTLEQLIVRNGIVYLLLLKLPNLGLKILNYEVITSIIKSGREELYVFFSLCMFLLIIYIIKRFSDINDGKLLLYEKLSKTKNISTIRKDSAPCFLSKED